MKFALSFAAIVASATLAAPVLAGGYSCGYDTKDKSVDYQNPTPAAAPAHEIGDIVDIAAGGEVFNTLVAAVKAADLVQALKGDGPFTVLAPTDKAFKALPEGTLEHLLKPENKAELIKILTYHVVPAKVTDVQALNAYKAMSLQGNKLKFTLNDGKMMVNNANIIKTNITASNGMIHVIDTVLIPSDKSYKKDKMKSKMDYKAKKDSYSEPTQNIVEIAAGAEIFNTLVAAVKAGDLVDALQGEGPFTVLAPSDKAFQALPEGTIEHLLKPENKAELVNILTYHVVPAKVTDREALTAYKAKTLQGDKVKFQLKDGQMMVNNANIVKTNIKATNGMIHVIDAVLLPGQSTKTASHQE